MRNRFLLALGLGAIVGAPDVAPAQVSADVQMDQWQVPWERTRPRDPFVAPDGRIWFVGQTGNYLAVFDPKTAQFTRHDLPERTLPHTNIVTPDGIVWVAGNGNGTIVRFDPKNGSHKVIPVPLEGATRATDPHTMIYDGKGGIWFTSQQSHFVGFLDIASEKVRVVRTSPPPEATNPYGIILDDKGNPWFDLMRTNKLGTIDARTFELKTYTLPEANARPRRIARSADGGIWYTDAARCSVGRLDPATGKVEEYLSPSHQPGQNCGAYAMTVDDADRIWYTETSVRPNRMVAIDAKTRKFVYNAPVPGSDGPNSVRHMVFDPKTRLIWYGADQGFLGAVKVPPKPVL